ncbi:MAG: NAD-dependent DNA ligase LigA [Patescibacteria group bacterium]
MDPNLRIKKLRDLINKYRYHRLVLDKPLVEESVEDSLKKELFDLETQFPKLVTPDSPTQRVGGTPLDKFEKFTHPTRMLSLLDAFNEDDLGEWLERIRRIDPKAGDSGYYCELKLDGLAIELVYEKGILKIGATRGDGTVGENVTQNLRTIDAVPLTIDHEEEIVLRGEVFITKKEFEEFKAEGYANPRNLAAGSIRQLDPKITASRKMDSYAYSLITDLGQKTHEDEHRILHDLGFKTNPHNKFCKDLKEVQEFRDYWEKHRESLNYEIDGIVVQINDEAMFRKLGVIGKTPRGAIAYKFSPREATTKLNDIIVSVGRTGTLTPVAVLEPVEIGGTTVSRATLHNEDEIKRLDVKIGDTVVVGRAGDVIPDIKKAITELRTGKEKNFQFPRKCPACNETIKRVEGEVAYKCVNKNCPAIKREGMYHFISKGAFDMDGIGPKIIDALMDAGLVRDAADLFTLTKEDFFNLDRFADKSAENAVASIQSHKKIALDRFIYGLGIPHVGSETAVDLARKFGTLEKLGSASLEELAAIKDIGGVVAKSIFDWFAHDRLITKLKKHIAILPVESTQKSNKLKGKTFVFTGSMESMSREAAEELVRSHGGDASSSVSKETSYVVVGSEPGSKAEKAKKLGVKILNEGEFLKLVQ